MHSRVMIVKIATMKKLFPMHSSVMIVKIASISKIIAKKLGVISFITPPCALLSYLIKITILFQVTVSNEEAVSNKLLG